VRDREGLAEEHRFMTHLRTHGAPVPKVLAATSGQTAIENNSWVYEVHEVPEGLDLYEEALSWTPFLSVEHAYSAGRMLARLHLAAQGFDAPQRKTQPLVASFTIFAAEDPGAAMERYLTARPALSEDATTREGCREALELLAPFYAELRPLLPALEPLWTHNDLHASNLLWSDASDRARAVAVIDFGLADRTNAIYDLSQTIERNIVEWLALHEGLEDTEDVPIHMNHLEALLDGYETVRPLSEEEAAALAPMMALGHAEFALTEADYFLSALHSKENARVCSEGYLVGHARWFRGAGGRKLLGAIRRWVASRKRKEATTMRVES
jgi:Ser/Thr protein kinase RdoA (MazF antagonist)